MKKIITILVLVLAGATSFAQYNHQPNTYPANNNNVYNNNDRHDNNYDRRGEYFAKQREIARINQDYNFKVQSIESKFFMSRRRKSMLIQDAAMQRDREIAMVYRKFGRDDEKVTRFDRGH